MPSLSAQSVLERPVINPGDTLRNDERSDVFVSGSFNHYYRVFIRVMESIILWESVICDVRPISSRILRLTYGVMLPVDSILQDEQLCVNQSLGIQFPERLKNLCQISNNNQCSDSTC